MILTLHRSKPHLPKVHDKADTVVRRRDDFPKQGLVSRAQFFSQFFVRPNILPRKAPLFLIGAGVVRSRYCVAVHGRSDVVRRWCKIPGTGWKRTAGTGKAHRRGKDGGGRG